MESNAGKAFPATMWTVVAHAKDRDGPDYYDAMNRLISNYWRPVYYFLRARGYPTHRAEDLTQEFFLQFCDRDWIARVDSERGRFRTFLLTVLIRFLSDQGPKRAPRQRAFDDRLVTVSALVSDEERSFDPPISETPEAVLMKHWAKSTIDAVCTRLRAWCDQQCRPDWNKVFIAHHFPETPGEGVSQVALAQRYRLTRDQVRYALQETNQYFAALLRAEISDQVNGRDDEVDSEIRELEHWLKE